MIIDYNLSSKTAGFNIGGLGQILWGAYEFDTSIIAINAVLKQEDDTEILNLSLPIEGIGFPMSLQIEDVDRDGNNPYKVAINPSSSYPGIGSREITVEKL